MSYTLTEIIRKFERILPRRESNYETIVRMTSVLSRTRILIILEPRLFAGTVDTGLYSQKQPVYRAWRTDLASTTYSRGSQRASNNRRVSSRQQHNDVIMTNDHII